MPTPRSWPMVWYKWHDYKSWQISSNDFREYKLHLQFYWVNDTNIPVKDNIDLLGANIDKNLQFNSHVKNICTKVSNQINVISRIRKIVPTDVKCKLYKAFIVPYVRYCWAVWHFCGARNGNKLEHLNKRVLKIVLDEKSLHYQELLSKIKFSVLYSIRWQDMMKIVFKTIQFEKMPGVERPSRDLHSHYY